MYRRGILAVGLFILVLLATNSCSFTKDSNDLMFQRVQAGPLTTREYATASASWININNDGYPDLLVLNGYAYVDGEAQANPNFYYKNNKDGTFTELLDHSLSGGNMTSGNATWADFDNDGDLDVFIANQGGAKNQIFESEDGKTFKPLDIPPFSEDGGRSFSSVWVDMDNDGLVDLHVLNGGVSRVPEVDFVYRNLGDGQFKREVETELTADTLVSAGATWADHDNDGDMDVFIPLLQYSSPPSYRNNGDFNFENISQQLAFSPKPLTFEPVGEVASFVDVDNDLDLDLFRGTSNGYVDLLYLNDGAGGFHLASAGDIGLESINSNDAAWGDYDNDGDQDLIVVPWGGAAVYYDNDGSGIFTRQPVGDLGGTVNFASGISAEDYDNDGDLDIFITHWHGDGGQEEQNQLYRNSLDSGNWVKLDLEGTTSNRSGIGARIEITARIGSREVRQLRFVSAKTNWRNSSSLLQHVGLGDAESIQEIKVVWPSGQIDILTDNIPVNHLLHVKEGMASFSVINS